MIENVHISHNSNEATIKLGKENIFLIGMSNEIREKVKECDLCAKYSESEQLLPMMSHEIDMMLYDPWQYMSIDVFFVEIGGIKKTFLVSVDHYSDNFELDQ